METPKTTLDLKLVPPDHPALASSKVVDDAPRSERRGVDDLAPPAWRATLPGVSDQPTFQGDTLKPARRQQKRAVTMPCLTIAWHPDVERIGERLRLASLLLGKPVELNRLEPAFESVYGRTTGAIKDPYVSRSPLELSMEEGDLRLKRGGDFDLRVGGEVVADSALVPRSQLADGVVVELARRVVFVLHELEAASKEPPAHGMVGVSDGLRTVRREIGVVSQSDIPVLLRGESGTGKELVAEAIHRASGRRARPFVAVNIAAIPPSTAAAELFGHAKGAFTGADRGHAGYFGRADRGTLFLDEIGEAATELQPLLLRALESGEVQPLGGRPATKVDVRVIAATDADLEQAVGEGSFRVALLHRLQSYEIVVPPLRERREDIGPLLLSFITEELGGVEGPLDRDPSEDPWLGSELLARLAMYDWPGNVRQLRNVARQLVIANRHKTFAALTPAIERMLPAARGAGGSSTSGAGSSESGGGGRGSRTDLSTISDEALLEALRNNRWKVAASARELGISKNSLYRLMERCDAIRKAKTLEEPEITAAIKEVGPDLTLLSNHLEVSRRGLQLRMSELGMSI